MRTGIAIVIVLACLGGFSLIRQLGGALLGPRHPWLVRVLKGLLTLMWVPAAIAALWGLYLLGAAWHTTGDSLFGRGVMTAFGLTHLGLAGLLVWWPRRWLRRDLENHPG
jgi:hypothetical protein